VAVIATGASLVPLMATESTCSVPSTVFTVMLSVTVSPTFTESNALLAVKLQVPSAAIVNVPWPSLPAASVCPTKSAELSTSVALSLPPSVSAVLVSSPEALAQRGEWR